MSSIVYPDIVTGMDSGLGAFIKAKRKELRLSQTELAERIGVSQGYMSQLESGGVGLPGADLRRRIASALNVRHLDILVATGELLPEEAGPSGDVRSNAVRRLQPTIDEIQWSDGLLVEEIRHLRLIRDMQRGAFRVPEMGNGESS